jgi:hypothetical protein
MVRDRGLEALVGDDLGPLPGLTGKPMFGGWAWLLDGHLLCASRVASLLVRLGKGQDGWATALPGIEPMEMNGRPMSGWVRCGPEAYGDDALRRKLLAQAVGFVRALPSPSEPRTK